MRGGTPDPERRPVVITPLGVIRMLLSIIEMCQDVIGGRKRADRPGWAGAETLLLFLDAAGRSPGLGRELAEGLFRRARKIPESGM
jgi:hypothetical protein